MVLDSLSGADRAQLHELYARSVMLLEVGRVDQWADLFAPGAVLRLTHTKGESVLEHQFKGRAELLNLGRQIAAGQFDMALGAIEPTTRCRHHLANLCLFEDGSHRVCGYAHVLVRSVGAAGPHGLGSGTYFDRLHRYAAGCWCFQSRTFTSDAAAAVGGLVGVAKEFGPRPDVREILSVPVARC